MTKVILPCTGTKLTFRKHTRDKRKNIFDKCLLCAKNCFQDILISEIGCLCERTCGKDKTSGMMPDPHHQDLEGDGTKAPTEAEILVMHLEEGHRGLQTCPPQLPSEPVADRMVAVGGSRKGRYATTSILDVSGIDRKWVPDQSDRMSPTISATDFQPTS